MPTVVLLGPQRFQPTVAPTLESLGVDGPIAVVTAGWQERESEDDELREHLGREQLNLRLYERYGLVQTRDPELAEALRRRQERLHELQRLYRRRLGYALEAAREMMRHPPRTAFVQEHRRAAIRALRTLDRQHLTRIRRVHGDFEAKWRTGERPAVAHQREQLRQILSRSTALAIAGGHVAVLLGRMRLFDLPPLLGSRPIVAWSAGAMAVSERVVLFHDSPPQGAGNAEVLESGLAACRGIVALPHASRRLRLEDPIRVALFARRFSPALSVALDPGARLDWNGEAWIPAPGTQRLDRRGRAREMTGT